MLLVKFGLAGPTQWQNDSSLPAIVWLFLLQMGKQDTLLPPSGGHRSEAVQSWSLN